MAIRAKRHAKFILPVLIPLLAWGLGDLVTIALSTLRSNGVTPDQLIGAAGMTVLAVAIYVWLTVPVINVGGKLVRAKPKQQQHDN